MANDAAHYLELAARAQTEAAEATLDNVRDRALRSAAVFESMALQHERTTKRRIEREASIERQIKDDPIDDAPLAETHERLT